MNTLGSRFRTFIAGLAAAAFLVPQAGATAAESGQPVVVAQADCYSIGQQVAAQNGGTLARASQSEQGGQPVCVIVVLVPGKDGQRPRRTEVVVPMN
jgi:hypothetical protein